MATRPGMIRRYAIHRRGRLGGEGWRDPEIPGMTTCPSAGGRVDR